MNFMDGRAVQSDYANLVRQMNSQLGVPAPISIRVSAQVVVPVTAQDSSQVRITIVKTDNFSASNLVLQVAVVEREHLYNTALGSNGERYFAFAMMDMLPNEAGTRLDLNTLSVGDSVKFNFKFLAPHGTGYSYNANQMAVVAFVQNTATKAILQAGFDDRNLDFQLSSEASQEVIGPGSDIAAFPITVKNLGKIEDTYYVKLKFTGPAEWQAKYTTGHGEFGVGSVDSLTLAVGDSSEINATINPNARAGSGEMELTVWSKVDQVFVKSLKFKLVTGDLDVVIVESDNQNFSRYVKYALDKSHYTYGIVSRAAAAQYAANLTQFDVLVWSAGITTPTFTPADVTALQDFMDGGGDLLIAGQDIGRDIFDITGTSKFASDFYHNYLHVDYINNDSKIHKLNGVTGDLISNGLSFNLSAVYTRYPEVIAPRDSSATPILYYDKSELIGGVRIETETYKAVYLGIGLEQFFQSNARDSLILRTLRWFAPTPTDVAQPLQLPGQFTLEQNYPNPFNPGTTIVYRLAQNSTVSLVIYNLTGQKVRTLVKNQKQAAGAYQVVWDGRDETGHAVSAGIYFYRLTAGEFFRTRKMVLAY